MVIHMTMPVSMARRVCGIGGSVRGAIGVYEWSGKRKARATVPGRSLFSICLTWLQYAGK